MQIPRILACVGSSLVYRKILQERPKFRQEVTSLEAEVKRNREYKRVREKKKTTSRSKKKKEKKTKKRCEQKRSIKILSFSQV